MRLKQRFLSFLTRIPGGQELVRKHYERQFARATTGMNREQIFSAYYERKWWHSSESRSGFGSSVTYTAGIRAEIPKVIEDFGVRSLLDAPCGDFNWFQHVVLPPGVTYLGADIVPAIVEDNRKQYQREGVTFRQLDIVKDPLPAVDLWLARAVLNHFSDADIWATLKNFLASDVRYLLTTSFPDAPRNWDILTGFYRPLNLLRPPFSFPPPLRVLDDGVHVGQPLALCLWERTALAAALAGNRDFQQFSRRSGR